MAWTCSFWEKKMGTGFLFAFGSLSVADKLFIFQKGESQKIQVFITTRSHGLQ